MSNSKSRRDALKIIAGAGLLGAFGPALGVRAADFGSDDRGEKNKGEKTKIEPAFGFIHKIEGDAAVNGKKAEDGQPIEPGDKIQTGPNSTAWIILQGSAAAMVKPLSSFTVVETPADEKEKKIAGANIQLTSGAVLTYVHKIQDSGRRFQVRTPTATAGVRGTTFFVKVMDEDRSYVCDCFGNVLITSEANPTVKKEVETDNHRAYFIGSEGTKEDDLMQKAGLIDHTNEDIVVLKEHFKKATGVTAVKEVEAKKDSFYDGDYGF